MRGPHGLGKTALSAWVILWFVLTRDGDTDWKVPTTAGSWGQLIHYLWPEIHKWANRLDWQKIGRPAFNNNAELLSLRLKLQTGESFAIASDRAELIEGAHASSILYIYDESKAIGDATFDAAEGAFAAPDTGEAYALACSTPGEPVGRFYEIHARKPGYEDWWARHVTKEEAIAAGRISREWCEQRKRQWGEKSAVYQNRVEGEFAASEEDGVIPLGWVEAANDRWQDWQKSGESAGAFTCVGVDVARTGQDKTVLALRFGNTITELRKYSHQDTMATTGYVKGVLDKHGGRAIVDVIGWGAGVVDRLREQGAQVVAFNAGEHSDAQDRTGELGFVNKRSAAWWQLREMLDPVSGEGLAIPPDDELTGDLTAPKWRVQSGGKIAIESKEDIKKRISRSTDCGDAVVQAFYRDPNSGPLVLWGFGDDE